MLAATGVLVAVSLSRCWRRSNWPKALAAMIWTLSVFDLFYISNTQWPRSPWKLLESEKNVGSLWYPRVASFRAATTLTQCPILTVATPTAAASLSCSPPRWRLH
jgi:hypothetical protein